MRFIDTNVLLYSVSRTSGEKKKRAMAGELLARQDCALSVQVLQEFYVQATRPSRPDRLSHDLAVEFIETWMRFPVQDMTAAILKDALALKARQGFSYWDCAIIAAARASGCDTLYSEDLSHGRVVGGVRIVNPFR
jgi:predicted nucleic acid-binding protein